MGQSRQALTWHRGAGDKTRAPRASVRLGAAYEDPQRQIFVVARNLSETGAWVQSQSPPELGHPAKLTLELPGEQEILRIPARVVRRELGFPSGFALQFDAEGTPLTVRLRLRCFVAAQRAASSE